MAAAHPGSAGGIRQSERRTLDEDGPVERRIFTVGSRGYDRRDVIVGACLRGEWQALVEQARQGLACAARLREGEHEPESFDPEQAAQEFRYARNLVTAEETEAWLGRAGLTFEDWTAYLERSLLRQAWADEIGEIVSRHRVDDAELRGALHAEAVCSGAMRRFAETLAGRAAVGERAGPASAGEADGLDELMALRVRRECAFALGWPGAGGASPDWSARIGEIARIEATFQASAREAITPQAVLAQIAAHRLDWLRLRWRGVLLRDEQAAREAMLCLQHDAETLEQVALRAGVALREEAPLLEDVSADVRAAAVSARPGDLLGPWRDAGGFRIVALIAKSPPCEGDAELRRRAEQEIVAALLSEAMKHVRWHERL